MSTTTAALISQLNSEIRLDKNNKVWDEPTKTQYLNQAYFQVQKDMGFKLRQNEASASTTTVPGTREYALPTDFILMKLVTYDGQPIDQVEYEDLKEQNIGDVLAIPYEYYIYGDNFGLNAIPDAVKTVILYYRKRLPTLTNSQAMVLPTDFDLPIVKYAAYLLWSTPRGNRQTAQEKVTDYKQAIDTLMMSYVFNDTANLTFRQVRHRRGYMSTPRNLYR